MIVFQDEGSEPYIPNCVKSQFIQIVIVVRIIPSPPKPSNNENSEHQQHLPVYYQVTVVHQSEVSSLSTPPTPPRDFVRFQRHPWHRSRCCPQQALQSASPPLPCCILLLLCPGGTPFLVCKLQLWFPPPLHLGTFAPPGFFTRGRPFLFWLLVPAQGDPNFSAFPGDRTVFLISLFSASYLWASLTHPSHFWTYSLFQELAPIQE